MKVTNKLTVLGLMSGTSLDGLDLALCEFFERRGKPGFKLLKAKTKSYSKQWKSKLSEIKQGKAEEYFALNTEYGNFIATEIKDFLKRSKIKPDIIASHGHTVFHQPQKGFSTQIGCGATIAGLTGITTICDFRSMDVAVGGQGAPLVPIGDKFLFGEYEACLNIGGIANISFERKGKRIAYDICEANMLLNFLTIKMGKPYDQGGKIAASGKIINDLLHALNKLSYYKKAGAKSLGREWFENFVLNLVNKYDEDVKDLLATATEHIAQIISNELNKNKLKSVIVSGGGAFNSFLMKSIKSKTKCKIIVPKKEITNFKEAIIFAFLGYLRLNEKVNALGSVTGASKNSIGGAVYKV